jgi:hypothetical protein
VSEVRRKNRIAVITAGYKDKEAAMQAVAKVDDSTKAKEKLEAKTVSRKKHISKNSCKGTYTAVIRDQEAPHHLSYQWKPFKSLEGNNARYLLRRFLLKKS